MPGSTGLGTELPASSPRDKADEVRLMFQLFDGDSDGKVTVAELKSVLQQLDGKLWTDEKVDKVLAAYDGNGDGELQFTEFWGWVCGHGGKSTSDFKPVLLGRAIEEDRERRAVNQEKTDRANARRQERERLAAERSRKQAERDSGERVSREDFVKEQMSVGVSREIATEMFRQGDEDGDGDIDKKERLWLAGDNAATTGQIRGLYQKGAGEVDAKGNLVMKEVEQSGIESIVQAFSSWDQDGDGTISPEELGRVLHTLNPRLGMKTVEALSGEIDRNRDGSIDIMEFVDWLSGEGTKKKKTKKKAKEEQEAKVALAMHRKKAEEAKDQKLQAEFEAAQHRALPAWCKKKKVALTCNTVMTGPNSKRSCTTCSNRHAWLCHNCGFVSFYEDCVSGCSMGAGWSCISGKCSKKCGCKKKPEFWQRAGAVHPLSHLCLDVRKIVERAADEVPS